jgi:hypothetical protein
MSARVCWVLLAVFAFNVILEQGGSSVLAQPPKDKAVIERIFSDWQKRQTRVKTIRYKISGTSLLAKGTLNTSLGLSDKSPVPDQDVSEKSRHTVLIDFGKRRIHWDFEEESYGSAHRKVELQSGSRIYNSPDNWVCIPRGQNNPGKPPNEPDVYVHRGYPSTGIIDELRRVSPVIEAAGIVQVGSAPADFNQKMDPDDFYVHGRVAYAGHSCIVMRTYPVRGQISFWEELWIDPARDSAIVRHSFYQRVEQQKPVPISDVEIDIQQTKSGWFPKKWKWTQSDGRGVVIRVGQAKVDELVFDPAVTDDDFKPALQPGMVIHEKFPEGGGSQRMNPARERHYRINENGKWILIRPSKAEDQVGGVWGNRWFLYPALGSVVLLATWPICKLVRRSRSRRDADCVSP